MKKLLVASVLLLSVLFICCAFSEQTDAAEDEGVLISEVRALGTDEGFSLHNYGAKNIDLSQGYSITDGEGTLTFNSKTIIKPGETITFAKSISSESKFTSRYVTHTYGDIGKVSGRFDLSNSGDDLHLKYNDIEIDSFYYGKVTVLNESNWVGDPSIAVSKKGQFYVRGSSDVNSASNWHLWGVADYQFDPDFKIDATVTPFIFPNDGGIPVYRAIEEAEKSICLTLYLLTSDNICALISERMTAVPDLSVKILLEQNPLGKDMEHNYGAIKVLVDKGADVRFIGGTDYDRYVYVHAKYCIIDGQKVVVTSENWKPDNLKGIQSDNSRDWGTANRGWGAVIDSSKYAEFMIDIFNQDFDMTYGDVRTFEELCPNQKSKTLNYKPADEVTFDSFNVKVSPLLSPYNSLDSEIYLIKNASKRIYSQQQSLDKEIGDLTRDYPIKIMSDKAESNVDTKLILNSGAKSDGYNPVTILNQRTLIKATYMSSPNVHNKGLICDDTSVVCSVNWTDESFTKNRETGVIIYSSSATNYYSVTFEKDFTKNYTDDGLRIVISELSDHYGDNKNITASVVVYPDVAVTYKWFLDGKSLEKEIQRITLEPSDGKHNLKVIVTYGGEEYSASKTFTVGNSEEESTSFLDNETVEEYGTYAIPAIAIILGLLVALIKGSSGKKKKKKGGKKR